MATNTYTAIATQTLGSAASSVTFNSIPSGYTDLVLVCSFSQSSSVDVVTLQVGNGSVDTGSNYSTTYLLGNGSSATSGRYSNQTSGFITRNLGGTSTAGGSNAIVHFMNYSNTTTYKTILNRSNQIDSSYPGAEADVNLWRSTSAINTIKLATTGGNIAAGSTFSIYGVAAASAPTAKATGGTITYDVGYTYHTFTSSGTFTPLQSLTTDVLVVGGGGGGGAGSWGGGGGAGKVSTASSLAVTTTGYSVVVGSGGAANTQGETSSFSTVSSAGGYGGGSNSGSAGGNNGAGTYNGGSQNGTASGGGAGDSAAGGDASGYAGGSGGSGTASTFTGLSVTYAGGGGGGSSRNVNFGGSGGGGGAGGGGNGGVYAGYGAGAGGVNTGSGGGGSGGSGGANGGSGIVIIRYPN